MIIGKQKQENGEHYASVLFFLKQTFLNKFLHTYAIQVDTENGAAMPFMKIEKNELLSNFAQSLIPHFDSPLGNNPNLLKIKTFELLLNLAENHPKIFQMFWQAQKNIRQDLAMTMETHFCQNLSLTEFAYLSGRSLATFKRDFDKQFGQSPARWLKERRLKLAHSILNNTQKPIAEIALAVGFEDLSHFARSFREQYGYVPSKLRQTTENIR
ncbi:MAG: helix-turn-helix domain-containing protein [Microscillaceae bacterium]|nr:helix-turn-helix domain-containing protein [Microscillaceae bacterium]